MVKLTKKVPPSSIELSSLLRKRKMSLEKFINDFGITSYEALRLRCERMGVQTPPEEKVRRFFSMEKLVNSPTDGIVVLEAPRVIAEKTGLEIELVQNSPVSLTPSTTEDVVVSIPPVVDEVESIDAIGPVDLDTNVFDINKKKKNKKNGSFDWKHDVEANLALAPNNDH